MVFRMILPRPSSFSYIWASKLPNHIYCIERTNERIKMVLMEHPESKVLYVGSVDESVSTPSRAQGLRELDIVTSMDGLDRLELQAFGLKSSRMKRLIEKRPLHLTVERGPPVNVNLLP